MNYASQEVFGTFNMGGFYRCLSCNGVFYIKTNFYYRDFHLHFSLNPVFWVFWVEVLIGIYYTSVWDKESYLTLFAYMVGNLGFKSFGANRENATFAFSLTFLLEIQLFHILKILFLTWGERWNKILYANTRNKGPKISKIQNSVSYNF